MTTGAITYRPDGSHIEPDTISGCKKCGIKLTDTRIVAECRGVLQRDWKAAREQADDYPITKRRKLPDTRPSTTRKFNHCGMKGYLTVGFYPDTEQPGEVFICIAKEGTFVSAVLDQLVLKLTQRIGSEPLRPVTKNSYPMANTKLDSTAEFLQRPKVSIFVLVLGK